MEELRSTEILDREIQDDARRKADKILKASDAECAQLASETAARIEAVTQEKEAEYANLLQTYVRDAEASIPLIKQRRLVSFTDTSVKSALDSWFNDIGENKRLEIYRKLLEKFKPVLVGHTVTASYIGYSEKQIKIFLESVFGSGIVTEFICLTLNSAEVLGFSDGVYLVSSDKLIVCRATREEIVNDLLSNKRQELAEALLGGSLPL
ncbi:MAG TPA: hypothetical protein VJ861_07340 [Treponemataceae bacterium]|nr:hypothetical protein [Treponemataceae bacterium]